MSIVDRIRQLLRRVEKIETGQVNYEETLNKEQLEDEIKEITSLALESTERPEQVKNKLLKMNSNKIDFILRVLDKQYKSPEGFLHSESFDVSTSVGKDFPEFRKIVAKALIEKKDELTTLSKDIREDGQLEKVVYDLTLVLSSFWGIPTSSIREKLPKVYTSSSIEVAAYIQELNCILVNKRFFQTRDTRQLKVTLGEEVGHFLEATVKDMNHVKIDSYVHEFFGQISRLFVSQTVYSKKEFNKIYREKVFYPRKITREREATERLMEPSSLSDFLDRYKAYSNFKRKYDHLSYAPAVSFFFEILKMKPEQRFKLLIEKPDDLIKDIIRIQEKRADDIHEKRLQREKQREEMLERHKGFGEFRDFKEFADREFDEGIKKSWVEKVDDLRKAYFMTTRTTFKGDVTDILGILQYKNIRNFAKQERILTKTREKAIQRAFYNIKPDLDQFVNKLSIEIGKFWGYKPTKEIKSYIKISNLSMHDVKKIEIRVGSVSIHSDKIYFYPEDIIASRYDTSVLAEEVTKRLLRYFAGFDNLKYEIFVNTSDPYIYAQFFFEEITRLKIIEKLYPEKFNEKYKKEILNAKNFKDYETEKKEYQGRKSEYFIYSLAERARTIAALQYYKIRNLKTEERQKLLKIKMGDFYNYVNKDYDPDFKAKRWFELWEEQNLIEPQLKKLEDIKEKLLRKEIIEEERKERKKFSGKGFKEQKYDTFKENIISALANEIYNQNSVSDRVTCCLNGAAYLYSDSHLLKTTRYDTSNISKQMEELADNGVLLAKMIIAAHSSKTPERIKQELIQKAKKYSPKYLDSLPESEKRIAKNVLNALRNSQTLEDTLGFFNILIQYERDGFGIMYKKDIALPKNLERTKSNYHEKFWKKLILDSYDFLSSFDPEFANNLKKTDHYVQNKTVHIGEEGICGLTCVPYVDNKLKKYIYDVYDKQEELEKAKKVEISQDEQFRKEEEEEAKKLQKQIEKEEEKKHEKIRKDEEKEVEKELDKIIKEEAEKDEEMRKQEEKEIEEELNKQ